MRSAVGLEGSGPCAPPCRWARWLGLCALAAGWGCSGEHLVVSSGGAYEEGEAGVIAVPPRMINDGAPPAPVLDAACPSDPAERRERSGCWPTRHLGLWRGFFTGAPKYEARDGSIVPFPEGELTLRIGDDGTGSLIFGDAPAPDPPRAPADPYLCAGAAPSAGCRAARELVEGFVYGLEGLAFFDASAGSTPRIPGESPLAQRERLGFAISVGEPWRDWCEAQAVEPRPCECPECVSEVCFEPALAAPRSDEGACELNRGSGDCGWFAASAEQPCACSADGCLARERALGVQLKMSDDGQALRGEYVPSRGDVSRGHLEFSREQ